MDFDLGGIVKIIVLVVGIFTMLSVLPLLWKASQVSQNPTVEQTQELVNAAAQTAVDLATPWWLPLLGWGSGIVIVLCILFFFAPKLINL